MGEVRVGHGGAVLGRVDDAGQDAVDVQALVLEFLGQSFRQAHDQAFGSDVGAHEGGAAQRPPGADVDDLAAAPGDHAGHGGTAGIQHGAGVQIQHEVPSLVAGVGDLLAHGEASGDVGQDMDISGVRNDPSGGGWVDEICRRDWPRRLLGGEVDAQHLGAGLVECLGHGAAQIARRASDDGLLAREGRLACAFRIAHYFPRKLPDRRSATARMPSSASSVPRSHCCSASSRSVAAAMRSASPWRMVARTERTARGALSAISAAKPRAALRSSAQRRQLIEQTEAQGFLALDPAAGEEHAVGGLQADQVGQGQTQAEAGDGCPA